MLWFAVPGATIWLMAWYNFLTPVKPVDLSRLEARSSAIVPPPRSASSGVTTNDALSLASVFRAVGILSTSMKQLKAHAYRDDVQVAAPLWMRSPSLNVSRSTFMEQTTNSLALSGNAYWLVTRNARGETIQVDVLNPFDVAINANDDGTLSGYTYRGTTNYTKSDIQHLAYLRVPGNLYGLGAIQAANAELLNARDTRDYASTWFTDSGIPSGVLRTDQVLSVDQAQATKEAWNATAGAKNGVAVLGNGINFTPTYLNPKDAQFIEAQGWNVQQVARLFGIPATLMLASVDGNSMTYTNIESEFIGFVRFTLQNYIVEMESALSSILPRGLEAKIDTAQLLKSDTLTRYQAHAIAIQNGWMTTDEVRAIENLGGN
jgi:HK97 family phage portal protein